MNATKVEIETVPVNAAERARAIRFRLPGQAVMERIELARVAYGPLYTIGLVQERVAETLPTRFGYVRSTAMEPIEEYRGLMPDEVLLKYDEAERSGLFAKFWVVTPTYYRTPQADPWLVAEVAGPGSVRSSHSGTTCNLGERYASNVAGGPGGTAGRRAGERRAPQCRRRSAGVPIGTPG
jgi:hypothetical protein